MSSHANYSATRSGARVTPRPAASERSAIAPETLARLEAWSPEGESACDPCENLTSDKILCIGICQSYPFLNESWSLYLSEGREDPELVSAFTQAFALTVRRCPTQLEPMVLQLVDHVTTLSLTPDLCVRLAHLIGDLGVEDAAKKLIAKTKDVPNMHRAFYMSVLRLATEILMPPDMDLAMLATSQMHEKGFSHCTISIRLMITGMSRLANPPVDVAIRTVRFKMSGCEEGQCVINKCLAHALFNVLDTAIGPHATMAAEFLQALQPALLHSLIANACPYVPCLTRRGCFNACENVVYMIADPFTVDLGGTASVPPSTYVVILYSSLRHLQARSTNLCASSPFHKKLGEVHRFLSTVDKSCVIPFATELAVRGALSPSAHRCPTTPQERIILFLSLMMAQHPEQSCSLLTNDAGLITEAEAIGVPVKSAIVLQPETTSPRSSAAAAL